MFTLAGVFVWGVFRGPEQYCGRTCIYGTLEDNKDLMFNAHFLFKKFKTYFLTQIPGNVATMQHTVPL